MRTMIAIPCFDMLHTDFFRSCVGMELSGEVQWTTCQSSLVYDARNKLTDLAIEGNFDRVLWLDSDVVFDRNLFRRLSEHLDMGKEMVSGLYFGRKPDHTPVIYKRCEPTIRDNGIVPVIESYDDYEHDALFPIEACGFGAVMTTVPMLRRIRDRFPLPFFPEQGFGEDLAFCLRAKAAGAVIWCDASIKLGHVGTAIYTEEFFRNFNGLSDD